MLENQIEELILQYLTKLGWFAWKNPTSGYFDKSRGVMRRHTSRFAITGASDIIAIKNGVVIFLEVKTKMGRQTSNQKEFQKRLELRKGNYAIVRSVEDTQNYLEVLCLK
jgi:Holliday junction resolvase